MKGSSAQIFVFFMTAIIFGGRNSCPPMVTTPHHALTSSNFCPSPLTLENHLTWTTHLHPFFAYFLILRWICCSSYSTRHQIAMGNTWWGNKFFIFRLFENHITLVIAHSWNPFFYCEFHPPNVKYNTVIILDHNFFCETSQSSDHQLSLEISKWNSLRRSQSSRHFCWPPLQHSSRERLNSRTHAVLRPLVGDYSCLPSPNRLPRLQQGQRLLITSGKR